MAMDFQMKTDESKRQSNARSARARTGILVLFLGLILWTLVIAVGSFHTQASTDVRRPIIVIACMSIFLVGWFIALRVKQKSKLN